MRLIDAVTQAYTEGKESASVEYENLIEKQEKEINELKDRIIELEKEPDNKLRFKYACLMKHIKYLEKENDELRKEIGK